jgi:hypothetical protein
MTIRFPAERFLWTLLWTYQTPDKDIPQAGPNIDEEDFEAANSLS